MTTVAPIAVHTKVRIEKGCNALNISKGTSARVREVTPLGAEYSHSVKVVLFFLNGKLSGKTKTLYARHPNRLADASVNLNDGRPEHRVEITRV